MIVQLGSIKTKSKSSPTLVYSGATNKRYNASGVLQTTTNLASYTYSFGSEKITYTTKPRSQRNRANMCKHLKELFHYSVPGSVYTASEKTPVGNAGWYNEYMNHNKQACDAWATVVTKAVEQCGFDPQANGYVGGDAQAIINSAWDKMRPDLTTVSVPNFLLEIDDIRRMFQLWKKNVSLVKNAAGLHLNYKFGWKPTMGDLSEIFLGLRALQEKIRAFQESLDVLTTKRQTMVSLDVPVGGTFEFPTGSTITWAGTARKSVTAHVAYKPAALAAMSTFERSLKAILDSLGFELNPGIVWEAIPFSFVVDWFFDVGGFLNRYKFDTLELPIFMVDSYVQYKASLNVNWWWHRFPADGLFSNPPRSGGAHYKVDHFHRVPIFPDYQTLTGLGWKTPTANQAVLGVSLLTVLSGKR